ncbi:phage portal protein [Clostridium sp. AF15-17LB]|nr:phage portal protein [Clostridium sp. AF15-17LB]
MPRQRSPDSIKAEELYRTGMNLVDIARELGKPEGTVRRWKSTQKWDEQKSERSETKANVRNSNNVNTNEAIADEVRLVTDNLDLTDKQRLFCCLYIKCFNATKAYQKAYNCDYITALSAGPRLLGNVRVKEEIRLLKQNRLNREMLDETDVFQWYLDIARSDITDFMEFGNEEIETVDKAGNELKIRISTVNVKNDNDVDGTLISEISKGKDGVKVKLLDKMKAMAWLSEHMDLATEKQRAEIDAIRSKVNRDGENTESQIASYLDKLEEAVKDEP